MAWELEKPTQDGTEPGVCGAPKRGALPSGKRKETAQGPRGCGTPVLTGLASCSGARPLFGLARGRGCGRLSRLVEAAPRPGYESAAGQESRGGSYGKATSGRGGPRGQHCCNFPSRWALLALLGPAGICLLVPGGNDRDPATGRCSRDRAGGTGGKGSGRGLERKSCAQRVPSRYSAKDRGGAGTPCPVPGGTESPVMSERPNPAGSVRKLLEKTNS